MGGLHELDSDRRRAHARSFGSGSRDKTVPGEGERVDVRAQRKEQWTNSVRTGRRRSAIGEVGGTEVRVDAGEVDGGVARKGFQHVEGAIGREKVLLTRSRSRTGAG